MAQHYISSATEKRRLKFNRPPKGEPWVWLTREMLESPAWRAMPLAARKVAERILIEHMHHAGTENGDLIVTYDNFEAFGVRRQSICNAIANAEALGFIDVTERGGRAYGVARHASRYGLTWLSYAGEPPTNRWKGLHEERAAAALVVRIRQNEPTCAAHAGAA